MNERLMSEFVVSACAHRYKWPLIFFIRIGTSFVVKLKASLPNLAIHGICIPTKNELAYSNVGQNDSMQDSHLGHCQHCFECSTTSHLLFLKSFKFMITLLLTGKYAWQRPLRNTCIIITQQVLISVKFKAIVLFGTFDLVLLMRRM